MAGGHGCPGGHGPLEFWWWQPWVPQALTAATSSPSYGAGHGFLELQHVLASASLRVLEPIKLQQEVWARAIAAAARGGTVLQFRSPGSVVTAARVEAVVVYNICDSYVRRPDQADRAIGTLLVAVLPNGTVEVRNCYVVPHNESADQDIMLEFRAGKMSLEGTRVVPDTRRGLVRIGRGEEGLVHFQWLDRGQNIVEDDQIIFPNEAVFEKVVQSSGRVYVLRFSHDSRRFFFWMQEPSADGDSQKCNQVNCFINQPLDVIGDHEADVAIPLQTSKMSEDTAEDDISSRAGNLVNQNMNMDLTGEVTSSAGPVRLEDLQRILSAIQPADAAADPDAGLGLGDILKPDLVLPLIQCLPIEQQLASYLPVGSWTLDDILELLQSPPFRQQVDAFTHVLRTGQVDLAQFGIDQSKYKFTVVSFLEALEDSFANGFEAGGDIDLQSRRCSGNDPMDQS